MIWEKNVLGITSQTKVSKQVPKATRHIFTFLLPNVFRNFHTVYVKIITKIMVDHKWIGSKLLVPVLWCIVRVYILMIPSQNPRKSGYFPISRPIRCYSLLGVWVHITGISNVHMCFHVMYACISKHVFGKYGVNNQQSKCSQFCQLEACVAKL